MTTVHQSVPDDGHGMLPLATGLLLFAPLALLASMGGVLSDQPALAATRDT